MFWQTYRFLTKDAKFKKIDSDAEWFEANFEQLDSCARCFAEGLAFLEKSPISRTTTVSQSVLTLTLSNGTVAQGVLTPISSNRTFAHGFLDKS